MLEQQSEATEAFISVQDEKCRSAFDTLLEVSPSTSKAEDQYDRYKIWSLNVGAGQFGPSYKKSLDYRLREAPTHRDQILDILKHLCQLITEARTYAAGNLGDDLLESSDDSSDATSDPGPGGKWTLSDSDNDDDNDGDGDDEMKQTSDSTGKQLPNLKDHVATGFEWFSSTSKLQATLASIELAVTSLYRIPVRQPATYSRLKRYEKSNNRDFHIHSHFDLLYVRDAFPEAPSKIVSRLGKLITERRRVIRYRQLYNEELQRKTTEPRIVAPVLQPAKLAAEASADVAPVRTYALTETHMSTAPKSSLNPTTFRPKEDTVVPAPELLSMLPDVEEATSVATTSVEKDIIMLPPRPRSVDGLEMQDFICPYCGIAVHIYSSRAWRKHVYSDLKPYVCTYVNCTAPDQMFEDREDWFAHECQHYYSYFCGVDSHEHGSDITSFREHMDSQHNTKLLEGSDSSQFEVFQRPAPRREGQCSLCGQLTSNMRQHLGRHLQRIALFSIPRRDFASNVDVDQLEGSNVSNGNVQGSVLNGDELDSSESGSVDEKEASQNDSVIDNNSYTERIRDVEKAADDISVHLDYNRVPDAPEGGNWFAIKPQLQSTVDRVNVTLEQQELESHSAASKETDFEASNEKHVLVMGKSGLAKNDFIALCTDKDSDSTVDLRENDTDINEYTCQINDELIHLYTIPDLDRIDNHARILVNLATLLSKLHEMGHPIDAILYLYEWQAALKNNLRANLSFVEKFVGNDLLGEIHMVRVQPGHERHPIGVPLDDEGMIDIMWEPFLRAGSRHARFDGSSENAKKCVISAIRQAFPQSIDRLQLYRELSQEQCSLRTTLVGRDLFHQINSYKIEVQDRLRVLETERVRSIPRNESSESLDSLYTTPGNIEIEALDLEIHSAALVTGMKVMTSWQIGNSGYSASSLEAKVHEVQDNSTNATTSKTISDETPDDGMGFTPLGCVTFPPQTRSFGIQANLDTLDVIFQPATAPNIGKVSVLICGLIGVGKSHLAREYIWRERVHYPGGIFWIDCSTEQSSFLCFERITVGVGLVPSTVKGDGIFSRFRSWIENQERWLLVFDNIDQPGGPLLDHLYPMIPGSGRGNVVFISRNCELGRESRLSISTTLQVHPLSEEDSISMVTDRTQQTRGSGARLNQSYLDDKKQSLQASDGKPSDIYQFSGGIPLILQNLARDRITRNFSIDRYEFRHPSIELTESFGPICEYLNRSSSPSAYFLLFILSFWGHIIPTQMIQLIYRASNDRGFGGIEIDLQNADFNRDLSDLIRCGLVESTEVYSKKPSEVMVGGKLYNTEAEQEQVSIRVIKIVLAFQHTLRFLTTTERMKSIQTLSQLLGWRSSWLLLSIHAFRQSFRQASPLDVGSSDTLEDAYDIIQMLSYKSHADSLLKHHRNASSIIEEKVTALSRCLRCIETETRCDGHRPCIYCKEAGNDIDSCIYDYRYDLMTEVKQVIAGLQLCSQIMATRIDSYFSNKSSQHNQRSRNEHFDLGTRPKGYSKFPAEETVPVRLTRLSDINVKGQTDSDDLNRVFPDRARGSSLFSSDSTITRRLEDSTTGLHSSEVPSKSLAAESLSRLLQRPRLEDKAASKRSFDGASWEEHDAPKGVLLDDSTSDETTMLSKRPERRSRLTRSYSHTPVFESLPTRSSSTSVPMSRQPGHSPPRDLLDAFPSADEEDISSPPIRGAPSGPPEPEVGEPSARRKSSSTAESKPLLTRFFDWARR